VHVHLPPVLGAVIDMQNFDRFGLHRINHDVRESR
jgi:hypothetical protein